MVVMVLLCVNPRSAYTMVMTWFPVALVIYEKHIRHCCACVFLVTVQILLHLAKMIPSLLKSLKAQRISTWTSLMKISFYVAILRYSIQSNRVSQSWKVMPRGRYSLRPTKNIKTRERKDCRKQMTMGVCLFSMILSCSEEQQPINLFILSL